MATLGSLVVKIGADLDDLKKGLDKSSSMVGGAAKKIGGGLALGAGVGVAALGSAIGAVGISAFTTASDIESATAQIQAALGVTTKQAEQLGQVGLDVFKNNFTGSIGEASAAVTLTAQQLRNIDFDNIQVATENALRLSDAFGSDLNSTLNAANVLMTQFGLGQQEAFDFLSSGFQQGLDTSGDFLDSVSEYGNLFGQAGADAGQFFSLLETGLQGGVLGTDKAADLFKEFSIKIQEGTAAQTEALGALGIDSGELFAGMADGSVSIVDAFNQVQTALGQVSDPLAQQALGVELMGTMFEDLGATAATAINTTTTSLADLQGSTEILDAQYDTIGVKFETIGRKATAALAPIGEILIQGAEAALPAIEGLIGFLAETGIPALVEFFGVMGTGFTAIGENDTIFRIANSFERIGKALGIIPENSSLAEAALAAFSNLMVKLENDIAVGLFVLESVATALETAAALGEQLNTIIGLISDSLSKISAGGLDKITAAFESIKGAIPEWLIPGSPPPLFFAIKDINQAAAQSRDISSSFGFDDAPGDPLASGTPDAQAAATPGGETIINLILDGQIIETIVSGRQGVQRQQRAAMGGATAL